MNAANPFSSRCVRPGTIPYRFPADFDLSALVDRLRQNGWRGEIIGTHGSGKSTLLASLLPAIRQSGRSVYLIELHDGQRRLPVNPGTLPELRGESMLAVDGYEQLSLWSRWRLRWFCRRRGIGLVVTAHRPAGFPSLFHTDVSPELAQQLVVELLRGKPAVIERADIEQCFSHRGGNLREVLFDLYDLFQARTAKRMTNDEIQMSKE